MDHSAPNKRSSALLTIDVQNDFVLPGAPAEIAGSLELVPAIRDLVLAYRKMNLPIVHVIRLYKPDGSNAELCRRAMIEGGKRLVCPGTRGAEPVDAIRPEADAALDIQLLFSGGFQQVGQFEWVMFKPRWGAFYATALEPRLKTMGVDTLVVSGCNFPNCPRATVYEASERDFRIILVRDAVSGIYGRGEKEMAGIGVHLMGVGECLRWLESGS
ncbi:MAG: cysteine hydrolase [Syntrophobacteraceae bacterium]|nr:cysteine hydrolase [Syntrophobacteraceae bacterium]